MEYSKPKQKLAKTAKVCVDKRNFQPHFPTILTKCAPFSSRALNFRYGICGQLGGTIKLLSTNRV